MPYQLLFRSLSAGSPPGLRAYKYTFETTSTVQMVVLLHLIVVVPGDFAVIVILLFFSVSSATDESLEECLCFQLEHVTSFV